MSLENEKQRLEGIRRGPEIGPHTGARNGKKEKIIPSLGFYLMCIIILHGWLSAIIRI